MTTFERVNKKDNRLLRFDWINMTGDCSEFTEAQSSPVHLKQNGVTYFEIYGGA